MCVCEDFKTTTEIVFESVCDARDVVSVMLALEKQEKHDHHHQLQ